VSIGCFHLPRAQHGSAPPKAHRSHASSSAGDEDDADASDDDCPHDHDGAPSQAATHEPSRISADVTVDAA
jgi:hypothetical protein